MSKPDRASGAEQARRKAEDILHQREEVFRLLVTAVREYAIFLLDTTGHVASWNVGAERLKGYSAEDIIGEHFSRFYPAEVPRRQIDEELDIAIAEGQFRDEGWRIRKDGTRFWADVTITPIRDATDRLRGFAKVTRDMTGRKAAEEERAQLIREQAARLEAERANRLKDEFLATLSHELRTPLNAILGWANLMEAGALDADAMSRAVSVIRRNAVAQTQLIADILDVSRITAGKVHLEIKTVELEKVIQAAADAVAPAAAAKQIRTSLLLSSDVGKVSGDPDRLQQVIWNLLTNAVKFTAKGGRIEVRLKRVRSHVEVEVQDTGIGIPREFLGQIFEPFRQVDSSPTRRAGGLGLGLAIVRHIVELHGGLVRVASPGTGEGSTFTVELPLLAVVHRADPESKEGEASWRNAPHLNGLHILVVEDDDDSRELITATLVGLGATVEGAATAADGLALLQKHRPDVLLSDIEMPDESGYDLVRRVRELAPNDGGLVPAIALTAYAHTEDRIKSLAAGFQMHIAKPVHPAELAAAVASLTARSRRSF
jgi:PAS domain S-box-containing protein